MEVEMTEWQGKVIGMKESYMRECKKHGSVAAFYLMQYDDPERSIHVRSGPFCPICLIEHQQREYAEFLTQEKPPAEAGGE